MYRKNKSVLFYFVGIFSFIAILVVNIYTINFLNILVENIVSIKTIKLIHDLVLINIILESFSFLMLFVRGLGIDFKKFNFSSDISKIEISDSDNEEFELNVNIDFNEKRRKRREKRRKLKYTYLENKFLINTSILVFIVVVALVVVISLISSNNTNKEGVYYSSSYFNFKVEETTVLNTDYKGNKITDNYLIVINANIKAKYSNKMLYFDDFNLKIENSIFKPTKKYYNQLIDLGNLYDEMVIPLEFANYMFVYEVPEKYINSNMYLSFNGEGNVKDILLKPQKLIISESIKTTNINEVLRFEDALKGVEFKINNYSLSDKILIEYNYCIKDNDCILSKEYLKPSIDKNYDKTILNLNIDYKANSDLGIDTFYKLMSKFGSISYKVGNTWINTNAFEEIISKRVSVKNNVYIGINSNILSADSIKILFNIRGIRYEYILK